MKKFTIFTFGTVVTLGFLMFLSGMNRGISGIMFKIRWVVLARMDNYGLVLIPIILFSLIIYYLIKKPIIYDKYKNALSMFATGLFLTLIVVFVVLPLSLIFEEYPPLGYEIMLVEALITIIGLIISIILGFIGFLIDRKKS